MLQPLRIDVKSSEKSGVSNMHMVQCRGSNTHRIIHITLTINMQRDRIPTTMPMLMTSIAILLHIGTIGIQHIFHRDTSLHRSDRLDSNRRESVERDGIPIRISMVKMQKDSVL